MHRPVPRKPDPKPQPTEFPRLLKAWMSENALTLEDVSKALGLSERNGITTVSRWRSGTMAPSPKNEHNLARLMGAEVSDFYPPGTFGPRNSSVDALREHIEGLTLRFDLAEEDLMDRITQIAERTAANERQLYALIDRLRAQGMAGLQELGQEAQIPQQDRADRPTPGQPSSR